MADDRVGGARERPGWLAPLLVAVATLVVVAALVVGVLVWRSDDAAAGAVELVAASTSGADPFTESVQVGPVAVVEPAAVETVAEVVATLPADSATGTLVATASTPGLYGGTGDDDSCDGAALVAFLDANPDKAAAWAGVLGIDVAGIGGYVASLTPVVLTTDTLVTNHGFKGGRATAKAAVLQAGTAVMIDTTGVPRVKCNCGNPLTPPTTIDLRDADTRGVAWDGYRAEGVISVRAGGEVTEFVLCNLSTGEMETRPAGTRSAAGAAADLTGDWTLDGNTNRASSAAELDESCPNAGLHGATLVIRGADVEIDDAPGVGRLIGTVSALPPGSYEASNPMMQGFNGTLITLRSPDGRVRLRYPVMLAPGWDEIAGTMDTPDGGDGRTYECEAWFIGTKIGGRARGAPSSAPSTAAPPTTAAPTTAPQPGASSGPCESALLQAAVLAKYPGYPPQPSAWPTECDGEWAIAGGPTGFAFAGFFRWSGARWEIVGCEEKVRNGEWGFDDVPEKFWFVCEAG